MKAFLGLMALLIATNAEATGFDLAKSIELVHSNEDGQFISKLRRIKVHALSHEQGTNNIPTFVLEGPDLLSLLSVERLSTMHQSIGSITFGFSKLDPVIQSRIPDYKGFIQFLGVLSAVDKEFKIHRIELMRPVVEENLVTSGPGRTKVSYFDIAETCVNGEYLRFNSDLTDLEWQRFSVKGSTLADLGLQGFYSSRITDDCSSNH